MYLNKPGLHKRIHNLILVALSASIPLFFLFSSFLTGLLVLNWLFAGNIKEKTKKLVENKLYLATVAIFISFALGLIHTANLSLGLKDLEHKLSLLLIPLVVFTSSSPTKRTMKYIFSGFATSTILVTSVALVLGLFNFLNNGDISKLFYHQLANNVNMHAVYLSCYLVFSFFIIIQKVSFENFRNLRSILLLALEAYIVGLLILLSSKTLLTVFILALTGYTLWRLYSRKKFLIGFILIFFLNLTVLVTLILTPYTSHRFKQLLYTKFEVLNQDTFNYDTEFNGLSLRLLLWKFALLINERENAEIMGVGTGDSRDKLNEIYREFNLYQGNLHIVGDTGYQNYNTHNQFVETYLKLGALGLLYLILYFIIIIYFSVQQKKVLFTLWLFIFLSFSLTETTLQTNKGIVYFSFFISIFLKTPNIEEPKETDAFFQLHK